MGRMHESPRLSRQVLVFAAVGVLNTAVDTGVFFALAALCHVASAVAQVVSYACGMVNSFAWNRGVTFRAGAFRWGEVARFALVNGVSLVASAVSIGLLSREGWSLVAAKAVVTMGTWSLNFVGSKWWVWRHARGQSSSSVRSV
ncbi:GtrA family protein [Alicyclobacillus mali]|uniref:GtrA family protein n=1 Tax=Alicyclobacillus mali (ex Roth et al. 2021) TaxID=1123961 RepID=A0ABS0F0B5_9BACL|nr:GtrA family protein [Alicyclobacillus mali (ex Roth et al. 2021)]MBF8376746.1 GtrA family protein [Alicyclobacillus mali (ex Roth et al. 2021)]MCL6488030.1 GtrA family protein [Alicyclobacillus mali (ex Roth et al. 2021)]